MSHINPLLELGAIAALLEVPLHQRAAIGPVCRELRAQARLVASIAIRRGRGAPMTTRQLAACAFTGRVAHALQRGSVVDVDALEARSGAAWRTAP